jgi:hypothetical protein
LRTLNLKPSTPKASTRILFLIKLCILFVVAPNIGVAQYVDSVYHVNGNVFTGQLKSMTYGVLEYDIDGIGTVGIEEIMVNSIKSRSLFEVKLNEGVVYFGSFDTSGVHRTVKVITKDSVIVLPIEKIVEFYPIKKNFWMRTSGSFSLGANYSKGSETASLVFAGDLYYRKKKSYFNLVFDNNNNFQADTLNTSKADVSFAWQRILHKSWSAEASFGLGQNTELGMQLRKAINLIMIRDLLYNNWNRLYVGAGFSFTQEDPYGNSGISNDVSGIYQMVWRVYKFTLPKVRVMADISYIPYFTELGRYRIILNLNPYVSIINDNLSIGLKFYYNYDSEPPASAPSNFDYGLNLQVAFSFH